MKKYLKIYKNNVKYLIFKNKARIFFNKSFYINNYLLGNIYIHKGNNFIKLKITRFLTGLPLGIFIFSRKLFFYPKVLKKKKSLRR